MTAITQKIRRFTGGISDQPDEQKIPGQVRDAVNCVPDVVQGLIKRPGMNLVEELETTKGGKWFFVNKANNLTNSERYVGQIDNVTGKVKVWDLDSGKLMDICYADAINPLDITTTLNGFTLPDDDYVAAYNCEGEKDDQGNLLDLSEPYFKQRDPSIDDLQTLTINDYTFITNRKITVQMSANDAAKRSPEATVELKTIAGLTDYILDFTEPLTNNSKTAVSELSVTTDRFPSTPGPSDFCEKGGTFSFTANAADPDVKSANGQNLKFTVETIGIRTPILQPNGDTLQKCSYTVKIRITNGGNKWKVGDTITKTIKGIKYVFKVEGTGLEVPNNFLARIRCTTDRENPKADELLECFQTKIQDEGFDVKVIGNSLYITRDDPFTVTTPNSVLLTCLSSTPLDDNKDNFLVQANDISQVPLQTKHDLIFQIRNSFNESDDYYVQFKGDNNADGTGTYKEVARPGIPHMFEPATMPHGILRLPKTREDDDGDTIVTFLVASFKWASREAGDDNTNPRPSFAPQEGGDFGRFINNMAFFRNRLVFLTDENVVCSVAGDFFNFWAKTAQTVSPSDPIDLQVSNNHPAVLYGAQPTTAGLLLFSENAQFMLSTENDVLEPRTARTSILSTYTYNRNSNPISLGTTVGFVSGIGRYTRFYEMANISRDQEPEVVEQTKVVERLIPDSFKYVGISKDNQLVILGKPEYDEVWVFRYFNTGERRAQSSWVRWKLTGDLVNHVLINDSYFAITYKDDKVFLLRGDVRALQKTVMLDDEDGEQYRTFLDYAVAVEDYTQGPRNRIIIDPASVGFPIFPDLVDKIFTVVYDPMNEEGYIVPPTYKNGELHIRSNIPNQKIFLGYAFNFKIDLPKFYVKKEGEGSVQSWDTANVLIQRVKLNFGRIGYYETTLKRLGRDDYTQIYEAKPMDKYDANELGYVADYEQTTPVYQRNTGFTMSISSEHPAPAVLYSATWEGQYQENYVKRL